MRVHPGLAPLESMRSFNYISAGLGSECWKVIGECPASSKNVVQEGRIDILG